MKIRVYVVEDHGTVRRGLAAVIGAESDMELCGEAADGTVALGEIERLLPDVVLVDITLPGINGIELIKHLHTVLPALQFVVLSSHDESVYAMRSLKAGARAYVMKQDNVGRIAEAIRHVHRGRLYVSDAVAQQVVNRLSGTRADAGEAPDTRLSDRELEIVTLLGSGLATREIAGRLHLSVKTVETHRAHIKTKLALTNASQLVRFCVSWVEDRKRRGTPAEA